MSNEIRQRKAKSGDSDDTKSEGKPFQNDKINQSSSRSIIVILLLICIIIFAVFSSIVWSLPCPINPVPVVQESSLPIFEGVMTPNNALQNVEKVGLGKLLGPESIQVDSRGNIYTGLRDGRIVKVDKSGDIIELVRTGEKLANCGDANVEHICGRPLGLQLTKDEKSLIVCDAYFGLFTLKLDSNILTALVPSSVGVNEVPFKFTNHLTVSSSGKIYFTDSSWKWSRRDFPYLMLEGGGRGRLMSFDMNTNHTEVLLDGLYFANGVVLSPDEDFILVCETARSRITKVRLTGTEKGGYDIFSENLPGYPDNIRNAKDGGYWLALGSVRKWPFSFLDLIGPYPSVKTIVAKILSKESFVKFVKNYGLIVKLDEYGEIVESFHDPTGNIISHISEVYEGKDALYLGSYKHDYLAKLKLPKDGNNPG